MNSNLITSDSKLKPNPPEGPKMKINVKKTTTVYPAEETPNRPLWLSNMDMVVPRVHVPTVYFYGPTRSYEPGFFDSKTMKESLSRALVPFYPMAGRLAYDQTGRIEILCNGKGVEFVEAETTSVLEDLGDFTLTSAVNDLIPYIDPAIGITSYPLMLVQLTYFKCGGVSLGLCIHHLLADGYSALHFVNTWADMARGIDATAPSFIERTLLHTRSPPQPVFPHVEYQPPPPPPPMDGLSSALAFSIFPITVEQIKALKAKSNEDGKSATYTSFQMLSAHIWRCACKARGLAYDQLTNLSIPVDGRSRINPPLPPGFMGNVAFSATSVARAGDLVSNPTCYAASLIHEAVLRMDNEYLRSAIDYLQVNMGKLGRFMQTFGCPNLGISSWMRLPFSGADFGWGKPVYARPGMNNDIEGLAQILSSTSNDGSFLLCITLHEEHMKLFKKYIYEI